MYKPADRFNNHKDQIEYNYGIKLNALKPELPGYVSEFLLDIADVYRRSSQYQTAKDIKGFLLFLTQKIPSLHDTDIKDISLDVLDELTLLDINEYKDWLTDYETDVRYNHNSASGKRRKISSIKAFFAFLTKSDMIDKNPTIGVTLPKLPRKEVFALNEDEIERLLYVIDSGEGLTKRQQAIHPTVKYRDYCIVMLLLGTGMRVSELVSINLNDICSDVKTGETIIKIIRKGGKEDHVYIGEDVERAIDTYLSYSRNYLLKGDEEQQALFVSWNTQRLEVRSVEKLLTKYSAIAFGKGNEIHPHNLRSTRGTQIYEQTGDIEAVKEVLGHESIATSSHYYTKSSENRKRISKMPLLSSEQKK